MSSKVEIENLIMGLFFGALVLLTPHPAAAQAPCDSTGCASAYQCGHAYMAGDGETCGPCHHDYSTQLCCFSECCNCSGPLLVGEVMPSVRDLVIALESPSDDDLEETVRKHRHRLLLNGPRNMVVILGGCSGQALSTILFVPEERLRHLELLGVPSLSEYLDSELG